jgi:hypothetical protein
MATPVHDDHAPRRSGIRHASDAGAYRGFEETSGIRIALTLALMSERQADADKDEYTADAAVEPSLEGGAWREAGAEARRRPGDNEIPYRTVAVNAVADAARMADKPRAAAHMCTSVPAPMPSAATAPERQPWVELRPTMYSVSGPGVIFNSRPESTNSQRSCVPNMITS